MKNGNLLLLCLIIVLSLGACKEDDFPIDSNVGPLAEIIYSPDELIIEQQVNFNAEQLIGSTDIVSWSWDFGDENSSTSTEMNPVFSYSNEGTYEVSLVVSDGSQQYKTSRSITVLGEPDMASIAWEYTTGAEVRGVNDGSSAPVIGDDGVIYYVESRANEESKVVAVKDEGGAAELVWASNAIGAELPNSPSIAPDGNILINAWSKDRVINKLSSADGSLMWSGATGADQSNSTPAVDSQGNVYHSTRLTRGVGGMYSWDSDGDLRWEINGDNSMYSAPAISADENTVYYLDTGAGQVRAINTEDGSEKWEAPVGPGGGRHGSSVSIDADGTIYYTNESYIVALNDEGASGSVKWEIEADAAQSGVVIGPGGDLYVGTPGGLMALDPEDGSTKWVYFDANVVESVPAVDANGYVYVGTADGRLVIVDSEGELEIELKLGTDSVNSPTISSDGTVYVEAFDSNKIKLYKIDIYNGVGPADSAWPMKGQNVKSTGVAR